jgi:hypothetical protein
VCGAVVGMGFACLSRLSLLGCGSGMFLLSKNGMGASRRISRGINNCRLEWGGDAAWSRLVASASPPNPLAVKTRGGSALFGSPPDAWGYGLSPTQLKLEMFVGTRSVPK